MSFSWAFKEATPGDRARESQVEKFFSSDAVANRANAIVREGIQNSLDASPDEVTVRVRIKVGTWTSDSAVDRLKIFESGFREHLNAEGVIAKLPLAPKEDDAFRYLTFEDFGTSGLKGDPAAWWPDEHGQSEPFFNYFRAEGISGKSEGARGRHGVGRLVFMFASRTRSMFGLTRRDGASADREELLMGTAVLRNHRLNDIPFLPDGWFGVPDEKIKGLTLPVRDPSFISKFKEAFGVSRTTENGLSVVVPWLFGDITHAQLLQSVIAGYYYPILSGKLVVEVIDECDVTIKIDADSIEPVVIKCDQQFQNMIHPIIDLAKKSLMATNRVALSLHKQTDAPKWDRAVASAETVAEVHEALERGDLVSIRVPMWVRPKGKAAASSFFDIHMTRDAGSGESQINFIREGIIISDARPRRTSGIKALVVIEEGPLAAFLGDSENPSHTQWQKDMVKEKYVYAPAGIEFVTQCIPQLIALISQQQKKPDTSLLLDLFALPSNSGFVRPNMQTKEKKGDQTKKDKLEIKKRKHPYSIVRLSNGFAIKPGDADSFQPFSLTVRAAYAVRRGNAFGRYNPADFEFGKGEVKFRSKGCALKSVGQNWAVVHVESADFEFSVTGFDSENRDLRIEVKVLGGGLSTEVNDAA